jgi:Na+-translocating ferredoxin:NAD+ oxidoreductase subunit B
MALCIRDRCNGCTDCVSVCPVSAISGEPGMLHHIDRALCIECGACGRVCPLGAVEDVQGHVIEKVARSEWLVPHISIQACLSCENCVLACPVDALVMVFDEYHGRRIPALAFPRSCVSCRWCVESCQFSAITMHRLVL